MWAGFISFVMLALAGLPVCLADVSLALPGFGPLFFSTSLAGVGVDGETTYVIFPEQPTGTAAGLEIGFIGAATLVEGASNLMFGYADSLISITDSCLIHNGKADCVIAFNPLGLTVTTEVPVTNILAGGTTAAPAPTGFATTVFSAQTIPTPGASASGSVTATQLAASSTSSSTSTSSGMRHKPGKAAEVAGALVICAVLF